MTDRSLRVLLVDDDEDSYVLARGLLSRAEGAAFELEWVSTYEAGLAALRQSRHDACLLDYRLGAQDGLELLRAAIAEGCRSPIIMLTAEGDHGVDLQALKARAADYLVKGQLTGPVLERSIRYAIERRRAEDQFTLDQAQLHLLTKHLPLAVWTTDDQLRFTSSVGGGLLGPNLQLNAVVGQALAEHFRARDASHQVVEAHRRALLGESVTFEREWQQRLFHARVEPLCPGESRILGTIGVALDITDSKQVEDEFRAVRKIQQALLPARAPVLPGLDIAGACHPAAATGGDYFDYLFMPDGSLGIIVADVSKHGFAPALIMAGTRRLLRTLAERSNDVEEILTAANRAIAEDTREEHFVTLFFARFDPRARSLVYAGAGHEGYVLDGAGAVRRLESTALPLGIDPAAVIPCGRGGALGPGQLLVLFTDGIADAMGPDGRPFGTRRALEIVNSQRRKPAVEILEVLYQAVREFCHPHGHHDDVTAVIVKVEGNG